MKLKILFFPVAVIVAIWASIWVIKPDIMKIKSDMALIETKETELQNVQNKLKTINSLVASLDANAGKVKVINDYLPVVRDEEEIINKINQRASDSKVKLFLLSINDPDSSQGAKKVPVPADPELVEPVKVKTVSVSATVVGDYEDIRTFLNHIHSMERINNIRSTEIGYGQSNNGTDKSSGTGSELTATIDMDFDFFPPVAVEKNANLSVFSQPELDFSVVNKVEKLIEEKVANVTAGETGKSNPFKP